MALEIKCSRCPFLTTVDPEGMGVVAMLAELVEDHDSTENYAEHYPDLYVEKQ